MSVSDSAANLGIVRNFSVIFLLSSTMVFCLRSRMEAKGAPKKANRFALGNPIQSPKTRRLWCAVLAQWYRAFVRLVAIDPGVHACGAASFVDGVLEAAAYVAAEGGPAEVARAAFEWLHPPYVTQVVVEKPQIYVGVKLKGDPNDLVNVALVAGAALAVFGGVGTAVLPREWKGNLPKPKPGEEYIVEMRARKKLSAEELARVVLPRAKSLSHNVWDSVALGLWRLGRH